MKYVLEPSLEYISNIKIAAALCFQDDVQDLLENFHFSSDPDFKRKLLEIENILVQKVKKLPLPKKLKEKLLWLIRPVAFQISKWKQFHYRCNISVDLPNEFFWTSQGTIDKKKTAKMMIKDESIDITKRYMLACIYCLEDDIKNLWAKVPESRRKSFYSEEDPLYFSWNDLVVFWTHYIRGEMYKMNSMILLRMARRCSYYECAFDIAATGGNRAATEFFLQKLSPLKREESLVETAISVSLVRSYVETRFMKENISDIFCFLLCELNEEQQIEVFKRCGYHVLICFLDWPLQIFFMEMANYMWNYLDESNYCHLLVQITGKIKHGYKDFDYQKLFEEFWEQSSDNYRKNVFWNDFDWHLVSDLFEIRDENNINLIFRDASARNKKYFIYSNDAKDICKELTNSDQLNLIKYVIKECLPSKDEVIEFKNNLKNDDNVWFVTKYRMSSWKQKFFCVLDDIICEFKENTCDEDDNSKVKRVCSDEVNVVVHSSET